MTSTIGIPIKLLNEAQGHIVTLEITSGTTYRGKLIEGMSSTFLVTLLCDSIANACVVHS
jgi:small nuclear ribonucleoprotein (snRNP)-like protein